MLLYQRLSIPWTILSSWRHSSNSDAERLWLEFQRIWPLALAEPTVALPVPLILLADPWWPQLRELVATRDKIQLEWQATTDVLPELCFERLAELGALGAIHHLGNFTANKQSFLLLEKMQPHWVLTPWVADLPATYWILHNVTVHDLGAGVLVEGASDPSLLLELEFNGYPQMGGGDGHSL